MDGANATLRALNVEPNPEERSSPKACGITDFQQGETCELNLLWL